MRLGYHYDASCYKFTGKERDSESGIDNFGARYNSSSMGRFMSPDPDNAGADLLAPQSWNAYSYVLNNPLNAIDPTGLDCVYLNDAGTGVDGPNGVDRNSNSGECGQNGGTWFDGIINSNSVRTDPNSDWVSAEGVVGDIGSNQQFSCGGSACGQDALNSFVNSITGGPSSVTVTDESGNLSPEAALTLKLAVEEASYYAGCIAIPGAGALAGGTVARLGQPVPGTKPFTVPGSSTGSSPLSEMARNAGKTAARGSYRAPVGGPFTGSPLRMTSTGSRAVAAARWAPYVGLAVTAVSAGIMIHCLSSKP